MDMGTEMASSPGPFRNTQMSKAAQTHKLRKLRAPSKCRECDSLVVFHGAECEEVSHPDNFMLSMKTHTLIQQFSAGLTKLTFSNHRLAFQHY
jgi:hypothetical protein